VEEGMCRQRPGEGGGAVRVLRDKAGEERKGDGSEREG
jgi:hypothetical protein